MRKRIIFLVFTLVFIISGIATYALYSKSIPSHVRIISTPPSYALSFWLDEALTQPAVSVEWGDMIQSTTQIKDMFYVRNDSSVSVTVSGTSTLPAITGTLTITFKQGANFVPSLSLGVGVSAKVRGTLVAGSTLGDANFNIVIEAQ